MPNSDQRSKVTIEDLLHLKKSERPAADFWSSFDRELRQKQLSALVEKRSWWHELPQLFARRVYLPIGATAILTFSLVSVKYYNGLQLAAGGAPAVSTNAFNLKEQSSPSISNSSLVSSPLVNRHEQMTTAVAERSVILATVQVPVESTPQASVTVDSPAQESPSARSIAANLAHLEQSEPELLNAVLGSRLSSPARVQVASTAVVELANLPMNGSKRNRLLAHYNDRQSTAEPAATDIVRERLSRRLSDSEFNDRLRRIGLKGDQVSLKF